MLVFTNKHLLKCFSSISGKCEIVAKHFSDVTVTLLLSKYFNQQIHIIFKLLNSVAETSINMIDFLGTTQ